MLVVKLDRPVESHLRAILSIFGEKCFGGCYVKNSKLFEELATSF